MDETSDGGRQFISSSGSPGPEPPLAAIDLSSFNTYLTKLLSVTLDAEINELGILLNNNRDTVETLTRFASDPQVHAIYVLKERANNASNDVVQFDNFGKWLIICQMQHLMYHR